MMKDNINKQIQIEYEQYNKIFNEYFKSEIGITYDEYTNLINDIKNIDVTSNEYKLAIWRQEKEKELVIDGKINEVPLFYQTDFDYIPYSSANVYSSGCGITSLAMVASYLNDEVYSPGELGLIYNKSASNNIARMENAIRDLGLSYKFSKDFNEVKTSLEEGKIAIILFTDGSTFSPSSSGHFVVLTGVNEEGNILVNDPWLDNYSNNSLKSGFENGFSDDQIFCKWQSAWIFDKTIGTKITDNTVNEIW